jgi:hypothetical protein
MEQSSNIPEIETYLEQLSVIRAGSDHLVPKERIQDHVLSIICSLALHTLMLFVFSISMFRTPAVVVSSDPASMWLIPFISTGDILSESELQRHTDNRVVEDAESVKPVREVNLPTVVSPRPTQARVSEIPAIAETADAELIVLKQRQHVRPKPRMPKAAAVESRPPAPEPVHPVLKTARVDQPVEPVAPQTAIPTTKPVAAVESQTVAETPRPTEKKAVVPVSAPSEPILPKEPATLQAAARSEQVRKETPATPPVIAPVPVAPQIQQKAETTAPKVTRPEQKVVEPLPVPKETVVSREAATRQAAASPEQTRKETVAAPPAVVPVPAPRIQRKAESTAPKASRPEQHRYQPPKAGKDTSVPKEHRSAAIPSAKPTPPAATISARPAVVETVRTQPPAKPEVPKGILAPKITGDIKLTVSGKVIPSVTILFQDFPVSRRNRPLSRAEARQGTIITPIINIQGEANSFVITKTLPGIYTFSAAAKDMATSATFLLKLFEGGAREATMKIGTLKIDDKVVVAKILMPEGIAWDDDAAFTGSLEDSDSITKFNSDTGFTWKEYK